MIADLVQGNTAACSRGKQGGASRHPYPRPLGCLSYLIKKKTLLKRSEYLNRTDASQAAVCQSLVNVFLLSNFVHSELYSDHSFDKRSNFLSGTFSALIYLLWYSGKK